MDEPGDPAPAVVPDSHLVFVDLRREEGCRLLANVMGDAELMRVMCLRKSERYVAAMHSHGGSMRAIRSVRTADELVDFVRQASAIIKSAARVSYALDPELQSKVAAHIGAGMLPAGRA